MKLSEILGWRKELDLREMKFPEQGVAFNTALTSCDREIDREALAKAMFKRDKKFLTWDEAPTLHEESFVEADYFISTMPTWLKRSE
mgnify:CR=1 FL=1